MAVEERLLLPTRGIVYPEMQNQEYVTVTPYKAKAFRDFVQSGSNESALSKLLDSCLVNCPLKASELHPMDYSALMFKVRAMTLGAKIPMSVVCPFCSERQDIDWDLTNMNVRYFAPSQYPFVVELPESKETISVRIITPKMQNEARDTALERVRKLGVDSQSTIAAFTYVCNLSKAGLDLIGMVSWYDNLPIRDAVYLTHVNEKINDFGIDVVQNFPCKSCKRNFSVTLRTDESFFLPNVGDFGGVETKTGTLERGIEAPSDVK